MEGNKKKVMEIVVILSIVITLFVALARQELVRTAPETPQISERSTSGYNVAGILPPPELGADHDKQPTPTPTVQP